VHAADGTRHGLEELSEAVQHLREKATGDLTALKNQLSPIEQMISEIDELRSEIEELKARASIIQSEVASAKQAAENATKAGRGESGRLESTISDLRRELEAVRALAAELSEAVQHQCEDVAGGFALSKERLNPIDQDVTRVKVEVSDSQCQKLTTESGRGPDGWSEPAIQRSSQFKKKLGNKSGG
jgi:predicted RNase H-like nuclease (RuvC/YqgF family)